MTSIVFDTRIIGNEQLPGVVSSGGDLSCDDLEVSGGEVLCDGDTEKVSI